MEQSPLVSVIVPVYNAEHFLERCVKSIIGQSYSNIELILVNDGSKDQSAELCQAFAVEDTRILVLNKNNGGAASARNLGIRCATGEYIGFCDADDYWDSKLLATLLRILLDNNLQTVECTSKCWSEDGTLISHDSDNCELEIEDPECALRKVFLRTGNVSLCTRLSKAEIVKECVIPEGRRVEDFYFTVQLLLKVQKNAVYNYPLYNCVLNNHSVTRSATGSIYIDALYFYYESIKQMLEHGITFPLETEYYRFKMYYLYSISMTKEEKNAYKNEIKEMKHDIRKHLSSIIASPYLKRKEKLILMADGISMSFCRWCYQVKQRCCP